MKRLGITAYLLTVLLGVTPSQADDATDVAVLAGP